MNVTEVFPIAMLIVFTLLYAVWRSGPMPSRPGECVLGGVATAGRA